MTAEDYIQNLRNLAATASEKATDVVILPPAVKLLATIKNRIQRDGKNSDGAKMTPYSEKPAYFTQSQFDKKGAFKPQGKAGASKGAKSMYLSSGYHQLREIQGKPVDRKNLTYRGDLMLSYTYAKAAQAVLLGLNSEKEVKVKEGIEKREGRFLYATDEEMATYNAEVLESAALFTKEAFHV